MHLGQIRVICGFKIHAMKINNTSLAAMLGLMSVTSWGQTHVQESIAPPPTASSFVFLLARGNPASSSLFSVPFLQFHFQRGFSGLNSYQFYGQKTVKSAHFLHLGLERNGDALLHTSRMQLGWAKKMGNTSLGFRSHYLQMNGPDIRGYSQMRLDMGTNTQLSDQFRLASLVSFLQSKLKTHIQSRIGVEFQPIPVLQITGDLTISRQYFAFQGTLFYRFRPQFISSFGYYSRLSQFHFSLTQETSKKLQATLSIQKSVQRPLQSQFSLTYLFPKP